MQHNKQIKITKKDSDIKGKIHSFTFRGEPRAGERGGVILQRGQPSRRARETQSRRGDRERCGVVEETERDAESSRRERDDDSTETDMESTNRDDESDEREAESFIRSLTDEEITGGVVEER